MEESELEDGGGDGPADVETLQAICSVQRERALELLEAASGSLARAVDIHLGRQQQQRGSSLPFSSSRIMNGVSKKNKTDLCREIVDVTSSDNEEAHRFLPSTTATLPPKKRSRVTPSPAASGDKKTHQSPTTSRSKQGTLDSFLGVKSQTVFSAVKGKRRNESATSSSTIHFPKSTSGSDKTENELFPSSQTVANKRKTTPNTSGIHDLREADATSTSPTVSNDDHPDLAYSVLAHAFSEMVATTKRNAKLNILKTVLIKIIKALGGIGSDNATKNAHVLTHALELISGQLLSLEASNVITPAPLQVSGSAVSSAVQTVTGISRSQMSEAYRLSGDLGDVAAQYFTPPQTAQQFFAARGKDNTKHGASANRKSASIVRIHGMLQSVASVQQGTGSQKKRQELLVKLLRLASTKVELQFLVRILLGNMRLGATMKSILAALAMAVRELETNKPILSPQDPAVGQVQKTMDICPRLDKIARALLTGGVEYMKQTCCLQVGFPIQPMLANPASSLEDVQKFMHNQKKGGPSHQAVLEWKYDGVRCQAHYDGTRVKLFSRHLLDNTDQFSDAVQFFLEARTNNSVSSFILDSEIVGVTCGDEMRLLPFQILSTRRGKKDVGGSSSIQIRIFAFDIMYLNGASLLEKPLWERRNILNDNFRETNGFGFASSVELPVYSETSITGYLQASVQGGAEGLMVKLTGISNSDKVESPSQASPSLPPCLLCPYESGTRSQTWLKVKRDYVSGFSDTIDVVPIGAWFGSGRKAQKGFLSPVLLAVYDEDDGVFRSISRCMSFTDEMYVAVREFYFRGTPFPATLGLDSEGACKAGAEVGASDVNEAPDSDCYSDSENSDNNAGKGDGDCDTSDVVNCFPGRPSSAVYMTNENPPIWFKPLEVWEVAFADMTLSKVHTAAAGMLSMEDDRGVALRFPRFKRRRPDKSVEQATTSRQIARLYSQQVKIH